ncbi:F-box protein At5g52880 [Hordeum vulgare subsp. vulgare]|uniref:F-box domain-containing protein n=1 Tax=Hordeum vulgare subsp. vulgare TaxID=112509 RepID=A0A8I7B1J8_HORVV|nr:F-box protein At5g52880 [Hordeum vulgare subsp. vulgare]
MPVRRRAPRPQDTGAVKRYTEMGIAAALSRPWDYPTACRELAELLRHGYAGLPKAAQALAAADVLVAFRRLPDVQTEHALAAANGLLLAVEASLPKQKKSQAVSEFKYSVILHKRRAKVQQEPGPPHIPNDVLIHIFSFLDMRSLVAASLVCWPWNSSANDSKLWKTNYSLFFSASHLSSNSTPVSSGIQNSHALLVQNNVDPVFDDPNLNWKEVFRNKHAECISWSASSNRAICQQCRSILWLSNLTCAAPHHCPKKGRDEVKLMPMLPYAVACYILNAHDRPSSSSDSEDTDSDSENNVPRRLWNSRV